MIDISNSAVAQLSNLPLELRALQQWANTRDGLKRPINPYNGELASSTDLRTWGPFDKVLANISSGAADGLGFMLSANDPYCVIDLDSPNGDEAIIAYHKSIREQFQSYTEVSRSGFGLHIIVKASIPKGRRRSDMKIEVYSQDHFIICTGSILNG